MRPTFIDHFICLFVCGVFFFLRIYGRRKRHRRKARGRREENAAPLQADSSANPEPSVSMRTESELSEEMQMPATPSVPKVAATTCSFCISFLLGHYAK